MIKRDIRKYAAFKDTNRNIFVDNWYNEVAFGSADFLISLSGLLAYYCLIVKARTHSPVSVILSLCPCKRDKSPLTPCGFTANLKNGHLMKKRTKRLEKRKQGLRSLREENALIIQQYHEISEQLTTLQSLINSLKR